MKKPQTAAEVRRQITELEKMHAMMLARERIGVIARMRDAISVYKVQPRELYPALQKLPLVSLPEEAQQVGRVDLAAPPAEAAKPTRYRNKGLKPTRYRSPEGYEWSGYGKAPGWIVAHEENGGSREDFDLGDLALKTPPAPSVRASPKFHDDGKPVEAEPAVIEAIRQTLADGGMAKWRVLQGAHMAVPSVSMLAVTRVLFRHMTPGPRGEHVPDALWRRTLLNNNTTHFIELAAP